MNNNLPSVIFIKSVIIVAAFLLIANNSLHAQKYQLWYNQPAVNWTDALPIGNGRLGAMIFAGVDQEHIQFNEETLWTGKPRNYNHKGAATYLPAIRSLLFEGKQKEAEELAGAKFMGLQSIPGDRQEWVKRMLSSATIKGNPALESYNDESWKSIQVPSYEGWETVGLANLDGAVWLRTTFDVKVSWLTKDLVLDLNRIRDQDFTYVNGKLVGNTDGTAARKYIIPAKLLKKGKNTISILVLNYFDKGGIAGYKDTSRAIGIYPVGETVANGISLVKAWKYKIQDNDPPAAAQFQASYQPFGDLFLKFKHNPEEVKNYKRSLDLQTAVSSTSYAVNGVKYVREYFASQPHQAMVTHLSADRKGSISFEAILSSPHQKSILKRIDDHTIAISVQVKDGALKGDSQLRAILKNGKISVDNNKISITNADEVTLYLTAGTNFKNDNDVSVDPADICNKALKKLNKVAYQQIKQEHISEYQSYYKTFEIDFGKDDHAHLPTDIRLDRFAHSKDPSFVALYLQYGRYLLISSSRPGTQPANLQGIWNDLLTPSWGSKYTTNINLEMNYWPADVLNLSAMNEPLFKKIEALSLQGSQTAKTHYNANGWVLHHNTDLWNATAPINAANHGIWVGGGGWLSQHLWEHYLFTQDRDFLKNEGYPLMKKAAEFYVDFLVKDPKTGWLISTPGNSPENGGLVAGATMDHQIIRTLFKNCIAAADLLGIDQSFKDMLLEKVKRIAPNQIGKYGQLQEWLQDLDDTTNKHRHVSHLWGVHPGNDITWEHPEMMKAARQSLIYRGDEGTGWSLAWKINFWARFKEGDHAMKMIRMLISPVAKGGGAYLNLFDAHPPFQIDGNFGAAAGIAEMIVQSHSNHIEILPSLPTALPFGKVKGIAARGGFVLNINWDKGKLVTLDVLSRAGETCNLLYNGQKITFKTEKGQTYRFNGNLERND
ncbi:glycosyl hydrolase family 95 catalytic domain-containing protein [Pedobacter sp.]|uniref:glycoside hydrolase family 95 protein n=1 Tax=Pedobacter sp. TaxID=1411316 RepID=UPI003D7F7616